MANVYESAFDQRTDLTQYDEDALLLFALEMRFQLEDIHTVAAMALTGGSDDKKCDLVYVDEDQGDIVIAQGYFSSKPRLAASSNKASDLNTAVSWLLNRSSIDLPESLKPAAMEIESSIKDGNIRSIQIWFVHNLPESVNVDAELRTVESSVRSAFRSNYPDKELPEIVGLEVGQETLNQWYESLQNPIIVNDDFELNVPGGYQISESDWEAYATTIPARWLYDIYSKHKSNLFTANIRGYLGSIRRGSNINHGIKESALNNPGHFWVYNNGLTALVHDFVVEEDSSSGRTLLKIKGLSIVNGAQTTGAIGSIGKNPDDSATVQARFVKCSNNDTLKAIIQYNNSQNPIEVTDFRSNDHVQDRLRGEFSNIEHCYYNGARRGGHDDKIRRRADLLPAETCSQALAAFHGNPEIAYHQKSEIWSSNTLYDRYFSEKTKAQHIIFCYSLLRSIEEKKQILKRRSSENNGLTDAEKNQMSFLNQRGSLLLLVTAIAESVESLISRPEPNPWRLTFGLSTTPKKAQENWSIVINSIVPFCHFLQPATTSGLRDLEKSRQVRKEFVAFIEATRSANQSIFDQFSGKVVSLN